MHNHVVHGFKMKIEAALIISFEGLETYDPYEQELGACYGENVGREAL